MATTIDNTKVCSALTTKEQCNARADCYFTPNSDASTQEDNPGTCGCNIGYGKQGDKCVKCTEATVPTTEGENIGTCQACGQGYLSFYNLECIAQGDCVSKYNGQEQDTNKCVCTETDAKPVMGRGCVNIQETSAFACLTSSGDSNTPSEGDCNKNPQCQYIPAQSPPSSGNVDSQQDPPQATGTCQCNAGYQKATSGNTCEACGDNKYSSNGQQCQSAATENYTSPDKAQQLTSDQCTKINGLPIETESTKACQCKEGSEYDARKVMCVNPNDVYQEPTKISTSSASNIILAMFMLAAVVATVSVSIAIMKSYKARGEHSVVLLAPVTK